MIAIVVTLAAFAVVFFAPLIMGPLELLRRRDAEALPLTPRYVREPRFFARSFREKIGPLASASAGPPERRKLWRSDDVVRVVDELHYLSRAHDLDVVVVRADVDYPSEITAKDQYVTGDATGGDRLHARTVLVEGSATLGPRLRIRRWIDAEQSLTVGAHSSLGLSASAGGLVTLGADVRFTRVFGTPVWTAANHGTVPVAPATRDALTVERDAVHEGDIIARGDLRIGAGAKVHGSLKCHRRLVIEAGALVDGSVIARGDVHVGTDAHITGHVFSESSIVLAAGAVIAMEGARKSVYSARRITLGPEVTVWGWVFAEHRGSTTGA
ncbi:MAG: polymer-forming cytoskeletal protein [Vulcanimicrobiaceae bacterium]|jgi:UDP-3-O-[3-hydroxymyristoyl] glucosamine N-acyltransferase